MKREGARIITKWSVHLSSGHYLLLQVAYSPFRLSVMCIWLLTSRQRAGSQLLGTWFWVLRVDNASHRCNTAKGSKLSPDQRCLLPLFPRCEPCSPSSQLLLTLSINSSSAFAPLHSFSPPHARPPRNPLAMGHHPPGGRLRTSTEHDLRGRRLSLAFPETPVVRRRQDGHHCRNGRECLPGKLFHNLLHPLMGRNTKTSAHTDRFPWSAPSSRLSSRVLFTPELRIGPEGTRKRTRRPS